MKNLSEDIVSLRADYRKQFLSIADDIEKVIKTLDENAALEYLNARLDKVKQEYRVKLENCADIRRCNCCGLCCKFAVSEFSYEELKNKAKNGDSYAKQFVSVFVPYKDLKEVEKVYPEYVRLLNEAKDEEFYFYHCPKVTNDNMCPDYENRPQICRDYPDNPLQILPKTCGFYNWKLKMESVSLKLNAETEIIEFYKTRIKDFVR